MAVKSHLEEEPVWNPDSQFSAPVAVLQLVAGRWVSNIVGLAESSGSRTLFRLVQRRPKKLLPQKVFTLLRCIDSCVPCKRRRLC